MSRLNQCTEGQLFDYAIIQEFTYIVPKGVVLADLLQPSHWAQVWRKLGRSKWPKIECIADDGSWEAVLRVSGVADGMAHVRVIAAWGQVDQAPSKPAVALPEGVTVEHIPGQGWRGMVNKAIVIERQGVEQDAIDAVLAHAKRAQVPAQPEPLMVMPATAVTEPVATEPGGTEPVEGDAVSRHPSRKKKTA